MADKTDEERAAEKAAEEKAAADKAAADEAEAKRKADEDAKNWDHERGMATINKLREELKEAKKAGKEVDDLKAKLQAIEDADKTELEKTQAKLAEHEAKVADANKRLERANLIAELSKAEHGLVNAQAAAKLIDGVEFDDDGNPKNLTEILPSFLEANAFLKGEPGKPKPANLNGGEGGGDDKSPSLTADELAWAAKTGMTAEEYAAAKNLHTFDDWQQARKKQAAQ